MSNEFGWNEEMSDEDNLLSILGLCGCGLADDALLLFLRSLERYDPARSKEPFKEELVKNFEIEDTIKESHSSGVLCSPLVWAHIYQLDHLGLIEHGGSAWCGWLTDKGYFVRDKLRAYIKALEETEDGK